MTPSSETVIYGASKVGALQRGRMAKKWMAGAVKPSHRGLFAAKAAAASKSTSAYAREKAGAPGTLGKEARLARTFAKFRPKRKGALRDRLRTMSGKGAFGRKSA